MEESLIFMRSIKLRCHINSDIKFILDFAKQNSIDEYSSVSDIREMIRQCSFLKFKDKGRKEIFIENTEGFNFFNKDNYYNLPNYIITSYYDLFSTLMLILMEVLNFLKTEGKDFRNENILRRRVSPPLEAFKKVNHNNLDIKPTGRDYGLLFE